MESLCQKQFREQWLRFGTHWDIFQLNLKNTTDRHKLTSRTQTRGRSAHRRTQ